MKHKKILVNTNLKTLIKNVDFEQIKNYTNDTSDSMLTNIVTKYKNIEHLLNTITITLVVDHENKAVEDFNSRYIIFYYQIENIIILNKILTLYSSYRENEITLCFIIDGETNKDNHRFQDYVINFVRYESNRKENHSKFENSFKEAVSYYVKNARKSILNSLFAINPRKPFRIHSEKDEINIKSIRDTLDNKYLNLQCPICRSFDENSRKYEISKDTIDNIIIIEKNTSRIVFNCNHEAYENSGGKFFLIPKSYDIDMTKHDDILLQIWTLKNFNYIVKKENERKGIKWK